MPTLSDKQSRLINSIGPNYNINYEDEAMASYNAGTGDRMAELEQRAADEIAHQKPITARDDLGGLTVYWVNDQLVAFYDYERFVGHIF